MNERRRRTKWYLVYVHSLHSPDMDTLLQSKMKEGTKRDDWLYFNDRHHKPYEPALMHQMLRARGFSDGLAHMFN